MIASTIGGEKLRVCDAVAEETEKRLAAYRREKEKFGKHPMWRRLTGLTFDYESRVTPKARKKGLKRLVAWLKKKAVGPLGCWTVGNGRADAETRGHGDAEKEISLTGAWNADIAQWARVKKLGTQLEELCQRLEISSARLSALTKECCGMTALEVIDGFKVERVRLGLIAKLREAARDLWGVPGYCVYEKLGPHGRIQKAEFRMQNCGAAEGERKVAPSPLTPLPPARRPAPLGEGNRSGERDARDTNEGRGENGTQSGRIALQTKRPQYFRARNAEWRTEDEIEERERRAKALLAKLRAESSAEVFALELGFANSARMNRACINVLGKTFRQIERALVDEVVRYYICAEDKLLREIASREDSILAFCARELYDGTEEKPEAPFLDNWSLQETFARDWLSRMAEAFG
ncbi:MAG TPA: hypothetical protein VGP72_00130 [Planctomycetota bacterium]|jgi:AraC-like DNA-binding protein